MKKISIYVLLILAALGFSACEDKGGASLSDTTILLSTGDSIVVNEGDSLSTNSKETRVRVTHNINQNIKEVTILSGEATLITGNYELTDEDI